MEAVYRAAVGMNSPANEDRVTFADLRIRTKEKKLIPFTPNEVQTAYLDMLTETYEGFDWRRGKYSLKECREDILKARQQGLSTLWLALFFLDTVNNPMTQTIILTDNGERSETLFRIIHRFYEHLPRQKKRPKKYSTKKEIEFSDIDSLIAVGTAGTAAVGRGGTVNNALLSERAYWNNGDEVETGLLESVPMSGNVVRETTANGYGDYYDERQREHNGESIFRARFFGWNLHSEYQMEAGGFTPTEEERHLQEVYRLSNEQLAWRRFKVKTLKEKFMQEYPINELEAFLSSGNPYFDRALISEINTELQKPEYNPRHIVLSAETLPKLRRAMSDKLFEVYEYPQEGHDYIVTGDPMGGIDTDGTHDYCSADVIDAMTWEQVAHLRGRWEPHEFGLMLAELGAMYDMALVVVLRANHGFATIDALRFTARYPDQRGNGSSGLFYYDETFISGKANQTDARTRQAGWPENSMTKPFMLDKLAEAITIQPGLKIRSRRTVAEMLTYVKLPGGKAGGEGKSNDDCVSSLAVGAACLFMKFERRKRSSELKPREPVAPLGRQRGYQGGRY